MIGSECTVCHKVIEAGEFFRIVENGVVHSTCAASLAGEANVPQMVRAATTHKEQEHG